MTFTVGVSVKSVVFCMAVFSGVLGAADTEYHVRPLINIVGQSIDGLEENSSTANDVSFGDATRDVRASADLSTGNLRAFSNLGGSNVSAVALAEFSETFTIRNGAGTSFSFDFDFDGSIYASDEPVVEGGSSNSYFFTANLAVFPRDFADWNTWYDLAYVSNEAIFAETFSISESDIGAVNGSISDLLSYSTTLTTDNESFHIFARIQLGSIANTYQNIELDFENTGTLGFQADPAVSVYSDSGAFPNTMPVPEPGGSSLLLGAMLVWGFGSHRRTARQPMAASLPQ